MGKREFHQGGKANEVSGLKPMGFKNFVDTKFVQFPVGCALNFATKKRRLGRAFFVSKMSVPSESRLSGTTRGYHLSVMRFEPFFCGAV